MVAETCAGDGRHVSYDRYRDLLPAVSQALQRVRLHTPERISMWLAQIGTSREG
jgi:predicted chitinase